MTPSACACWSDSSAEAPGACRLGNPCGGAPGPATGAGAAAKAGCGADDRSGRPRMDSHAVLAAYDDQIRRNPAPTARTVASRARRRSGAQRGSRAWLERGDLVRPRRGHRGRGDRRPGRPLRRGVPPVGVEALLHDRPADLPERLVAAGLTRAGGDPAGRGRRRPRSRRGASAGRGARSTSSTRRGPRRWSVSTTRCSARTTPRSAGTSSTGWPGGRRSRPWSPWPR